MRREEPEQEPQLDIENPINAEPNAERREQRITSCIIDAGSFLLLLAGSGFLGLGATRNNHKAWYLAWGFFCIGITFFIGAIRTRDQNRNLSNVYLTLAAGSFIGLTTVTGLSIFYKSRTDNNNSIAGSNLEL
jgi:hypothetical protein